MHFKTWMMIDIGISRTPEDLKKAVRASGADIYPGAELLINHPRCILTQREKRIELVLVKRKDLEFLGDEESGEKLKRHGLKLCPAEVGPQLRRQYPFQQQGEIIHIGMDPIKLPSNDLEIFCVSCSNKGERALTSKPCFLPDWWRGITNLVLMRL